MYEISYLVQVYVVLTDFNKYHLSTLSLLSYFSTDNPPPCRSDVALTLNLFKRSLKLLSHSLSELDNKSVWDRLI